jgi:hypothetical protein
MAQDLNELMDVGGGATGASKVPEPVAKTATLPNSKKQGDLLPQKLEGDVEDTDSENNTKPTGDMSAKNRASVETHGGGSMKEDMEVLFDGEDLSEEFKNKATTIFEAAVGAKIALITEELESEYQNKLEESLSIAIKDISTKLDDYMNYVVQEWMEENRVAIESSLRSEVTEEFIEGLKSLFAEHYIEIPEDKVNVVEELSDRVEELEEKLNEAISDNIELNKHLTESVKSLVFADVAEDLADTQIDKFASLAEGVVFVDADNYKRKLEIVKETYFSSKMVKSNMIQEEVDNAGDESLALPVKLSGPVANYVQAISRTIKK